MASHADVHDLLEQIKLLSPKGYTRDDLDRLNFSSAVPVIAVIKERLLEVATDDVHTLPQFTIDFIFEVSNSYLRALQDLTSYTKKHDGTDDDRHRAIIVSLNEIYERNKKDFFYLNLHSQFKKFTAEANSMRSGMDDRLQHANEVLSSIEAISKKVKEEQTSAIETIKNEVQDTRNYTKDKRKELDNVVSVARKQVGSIGISQYGDFFKTEAGYHEVAAKEWEGRTFWVFFALITIAAVSSTLIRALNGYFPNLPTHEILLTKAAIFTVIIFSLLFCIKNYLAHKHNRLINQQRHLTLITYNSIMQAGNTEDTRDIMLSRVANCIFNQGETGFLRQGSGGNTIKVVENLKLPGTRENP